MLETLSTLYRDSKREVFYWLGLSALVVTLDQFSKEWISNHFSYGESLGITRFFNLVLAHNQGAAFSFLHNAGGWQRWFFSAVAILASVWLIWLLLKHAGQKLFCFALAMILGGALGNLMDRVAQGYVVDFLDFFWNDTHFPAFNLADSAITCGAGLMLIESFITRRQTP